MTRNRTISVVIPTCDRAELLREAIDSVIHQSRPPLEVIVVNNGKDELSLASISPLVKTLRIDAYAGVSRARNAGAEIASGEYVAFLDDDDNWAPDYLLHAERVIQRDQPDVILATLNWVAEDKIIQTRCLPDKYTDSELLLDCFVSGSNTSVRKEAFVRAGGYDPELSWGEDATLVAVMRSQGARIVSAPEMHTLYHQHTGARLSTSQSSEKILRYYERNVQHMGTGQRMYCKMRIAREKARETHSLKHYLISKIYRASHKILSVFN